MDIVDDYTATVKTAWDAAAAAHDALKDKHRHRLIQLEEEFKTLIAMVEADYARLIAPLDEYRAKLTTEAETLLNELTERHNASIAEQNRLLREHVDQFQQALKAFEASDHGSPVSPGKRNLDCQRNQGRGEPMKGERKMAYNPARGGHAPGHLRDRFLELIEGGMPDGEAEREELRTLCGQLWNCTDTIPSGYAEGIDLKAGSYAMVARQLRADWDIYPPPRAA